MSEKHPQRASAQVEKSRSKIEPLLTRVLDTLAAEAPDHSSPRLFFRALLERLDASNTEIELLKVLFDLSTTPFQSFQLSTETELAVVQLMAGCEYITLTLSETKTDQGGNED